jgi:hypothetical protein
MNSRALLAKAGGKNPSLVAVSTATNRSAPDPRVDGGKCLNAAHAEKGHGSGRPSFRESLIL